MNVTGVFLSSAAHTAKTDQLPYQRKCKIFNRSASDNEQYSLDATRTDLSLRDISLRNVFRFKRRVRTCLFVTNLQGRRVFEELIDSLCVAFKGQATNQTRWFQQSGITTGIRPGMCGINNTNTSGCWAGLNTVSVKLQGTTRDNITIRI